MKFTAERSIIQAALSFVTRYAAKGERIPILADILLEAAGGSVVATATDADQSARTSFAADVDDEGSICVPAALLFKAIDSAAGTDVRLEADDRCASVACGKQKFKLPVLPASDFPVPPMLTAEGASFVLGGSLLHRVSKDVAFAAEDQKGRFYLAGTSWRASGGKIEFCATDGKRLSMLTAKCPAIVEMIVPVFDVPAWESEVTVTSTQQFIRLQCGSQVVASKLIEAGYPDIHRIIPRDGKPLLFDRAELLLAIKRATLISDARDNSVLIVGRDGIATVSCQAADKQAADEIAYEGDDFQIAFASPIITSVITSFDSEMIELRYTDHMTAITAHDPHDDARLGFAMPYQDRRVVEYLPSAREAA